LASAPGEEAGAATAAGGPSCCMLFVGLCVGAAADQRASCHAKKMK
jgi:hypothetical protein